MKAVSVIGLETIPEVQRGDDIADLIVEACEKEGVKIVPGDIVVITSKIVSKSEGSIIELKNVKPSRRSRAIAKLTGKDAVDVEVIRRYSRKIAAAIPVKKIAKHYPRIFESLTVEKQDMEKVVEAESTILLTIIDNNGLVSEAGIDYSNNPQGLASLLPSNPDGSALKIRGELANRIGGDVAVVITDTEIAFTHIYGSTEVAIGFSGIYPVAQRFASADRFGKKKFGGADIIVDEVASAAALLMGQTSEGIPVVIVHGLKYSKEDVAMRYSTDATGKAVWWSMLATVKLKLAWLLEPFV